MREILFRGKRITKRIEDIWVEGSLLRYEDGDCDICSPSGIPGELCKYSVHPSTVGQYTGMTDKNGTKIFEGDILSTENGTFENTGRGYIRFHDGRFVSYYGQDIINRECFDELCEVCSDREVIGNIHDTPELLEE